MKRGTSRHSTLSPLTAGIKPTCYHLIGSLQTPEHIIWSNRTITALMKKKKTKIIRSVVSWWLSAAVGAPTVPHIYLLCVEKSWESTRLLISCSCTLKYLVYLFISNNSMTNYHHHHIVHSVKSVCIKIKIKVFSRSKMAAREICCWFLLGIKTHSQKICSCLSHATPSYNSTVCWWVVLHIFIVIKQPISPSKSWHAFRS